MRVLAACCVLLASAPAALAADYGDVPLRGSQHYSPGFPKYVRWSGAYVGGQAGISFGSADFSSGVGSLVAHILRNTTIENEARVSTWATLGRATSDSVAYGGFVGYNYQWENAVLGFEANYNHTSMTLLSSDSLARSYQTTDGYFYNINLLGLSRIQISDYGTIRVRGGWVYDTLMPYGFIGVAIARGEATRSATVNLTATDLVAPVGPPLALAQTLNDNASFVAFGWAIGAGVEWAVTSHIFLRAEYEYVHFGDVKDANVHFNSARGALGLKF